MAIVTSSDVFSSDHESNQCNGALCVVLGHVHLVPLLTQFRRLIASAAQRFIPTAQPGSGVDSVDDAISFVAER